MMSTYKIIHECRVQWMPVLYHHPLFCSSWCCCCYCILCPMLWRWKSLIVIHPGYFEVLSRSFEHVTFLYFLNPVIHPKCNIMQSVISQQTIHKCDNDKGREGCLMQVSWLVMCADYFIEGDDNDFDYTFWLLRNWYHN